MRRAALTICVVTLGLAGCKKDELEAELANVRAQLADTEGQLGAEKQKNEQLTAENQTLQDRITQLDAEIAQLNAQIEQLAKDAGATKAELDALRAEKAKREAELDTYRKLIAGLKKLVDAGTIKLSFRRGRLVVELSSNILFSSGKTNLKDEGQAALTELSAALTAVKDRDFLVAGHTDNVPIRTARFTSNWALSTARSVEVVTFLIEQGMPAEHIGAAGFGEFDPVGDNSTPEGRKMNRRIEIILMPTLGDIPGMKEMLQGK